MSYPNCAARGNVLDLWAAVHRIPLRRDAALQIADTFGIDLTQASSTADKL